MIRNFQMFRILIRTDFLVALPQELYSLEEKFAGTKRDLVKLAVLYNEINQFGFYPVRLLFSRLNSWKESLMAIDRVSGNTFLACFGDDPIYKNLRVL